MDVSRRTFLKTTVIGGAGVTVFGFSLAPVYAQTQGLKIARTTETRKGELSLGRTRMGELRGADATAPGRKAAA